MGVLKALIGGVWRKVGCGGRPPGIADDFNRADGSSVLLDRSDGGSWLGGSTQEILSNRLIRIGNGFSTPPIGWLYADYGYDETVSVSCDYNFPFADGAIHWWIATDPSASDTIMVLFDANFGRLAVERGGVTLATATVSGYGLHTLTIDYDYGTGALDVGLDGTSYITLTITGLTGTFLALRSSRDWATFQAYYDNLVVTGTGGPAGRLRLQLPNGSWVREACDDEPARTILSDDANRPDGTSVVLNRSDGGAWVNPDGTWEIDGNELYRTSWGITTLTDDWLAADYDAHGTITITLELRQPNPYQFQRIYFAKQSLDSGGGNGYQISIAQVEHWLALHREGTDNAQVWGGSFAGPSWEDGGAALHTMVITFNEATRHITVSFDGTPYISYTDTLSHPVGTVLGLLADSRASQTFDNVEVIGIPNGHPLKIEDPSSPGDWITVARMVPADNFWTALIGIWSGLDDAAAAISALGGIYSDTALATVETRHVNGTITGTVHSVNGFAGIAFRIAGPDDFWVAHWGGLYCVTTAFGYDLVDSLIGCPTDGQITVELDGDHIIVSTGGTVLYDNHDSRHITATRHGRYDTSSDDLDTFGPWSFTP